MKTLSIGIGVMSRKMSGCTGRCVKRCRWATGMDEWGAFYLLAFIGVSYLLPLTHVVQSMAEPWLDASITEPLRLARDSCDSCFGALGDC